VLDVIIRGATVYDGSGGPARRADVGVRDGRVANVGVSDEPARTTVDSGGLALMPGIVDVHTHYDAQITWDPTLSPSPSLGVTTAVMGNCGFGIAPSPPRHRDLLLKNLSVVEGMDLDALLAGTRWDFETFPQYMDAIRACRPYANVAVLAQHSTIRTAVMGEAACERRDPTADELAAMRETVRGAIRAGAIGFGSSFSPNHSGWGRGRAVDARHRCELARSSACSVRRNAGSSSPPRGRAPRRSTWRTSPPPPAGRRSS
jgi:N-acyl-D-aspartate/D-glutamate deacylase